MKLSEIYTTDGGLVTKVFNQSAELMGLYGWGTPTELYNEILTDASMLKKLKVTPAQIKQILGLSAAGRLTLIERICAEVGIDANTFVSEPAAMQKFRKISDLIIFDPQSTDDNVQTIIEAINSCGLDINKKYTVNAEFIDWLGENHETVAKAFAILYKQKVKVPVQLQASVYMAYKYCEYIGYMS